MTNKAKIWGTALLIGLTPGFLLSCSQEDDADPTAPTIRIIHLGTHESPDDRIFYTGVPIHLEADIKAPGLIQKIELEILQKSGYGNHKVKKEYTGSYVGQKEVPGFYEHADLLDEVALGEYSVQLKVTDQQGKTGSVYDIVTIRSGDGQGGEHNHDH